MASHQLMDGKLQVFRIGKSRFWQARTRLGGKQHKLSTKQESLEHAKDVAEDWFLRLKGKDAAGLLSNEKTFADGAEKFLKEYPVIVNGQRSAKWVESHAIRLRLHLIPFFGEMPLSKINAGKGQDYRVHRMTTWKLPNPHSHSKRLVKDTPPSRSTLHNEFVTLSLVLQTCQRHGWLDHLPNMSPPYKAQGKITHRPWFSPQEYKQLYEATRAYSKQPFHEHYKWNAEQVHDYVLFMANTGLRPDEAKNLQHRDVTIAEDHDTGERILEIEVRGKRGVGYCKSMPKAVQYYERLKARPKPSKHESRRKAQQRRREGSEVPPAPKVEYPGPNDHVFPGNHIKLFNNILNRTELKKDRDGNLRTAYSLRHTYICMRLMEGADIYQIAKNCRTSVEMIEKFYAAHIKNTLDASAINIKRAKPARAKTTTKKSAKSKAAVEDDEY